MADDTVQAERKQFLKNQFFLASWAGASQHNKIWNHITAKKNQVAFKHRLRVFLETMLDSYKDCLSSDTYTENITKLQAESVAAGERLTLGTCQKLLNLLCKYYWCAGWITEPPHFPIDRQILGALGINKNWTEIDDRAEYTKIIQKAAASATPKTVAQWELIEWNK